MADAESRGEVVGGRTRAGRDRGFSLIEVVVTLTLMAVVLLPILNAVATTIKASSQGRAAAQVETALVNAADRVNRAPMSCHYEMYAEAAVPQFKDFVVTVSYAYYAPNAAPADRWVPQACEDGMDSPRDGLVQRVVVAVTSPNGDIRREIQVVKSRV